MIRAQSPSIWRQTADSPLLLTDPAFGGVADGVFDEDDATSNWSTATNNSAALLALATASRDTKRKGVVPNGTFILKSSTTLDDCNNVWLEGAPGSLLVYTNPQNQRGLSLGSAVAGVNLYRPEDSGITLAEATVTGSNILVLKTSIIGKTPTQDLRKGMSIRLSDPSQPFKYRAQPFALDKPGSISFYKPCVTWIDEILSDTEIAVGGTTAWDFNEDTLFGYWNAPNLNVVIDGLNYAYDSERSYKDGVASALSLFSCIDPIQDNVAVDRPTTRAFSWVDCIRGKMGSLRGTRALPTFGSLFTNQSGVECTFWDLYSEGGTHTYDDGGSGHRPALDNKIIGLTARNAGGGAAGGHEASKGLEIHAGRVFGQQPLWNRDGDPNTDENNPGAGFALRGHQSKLIDCEVSDCANGALLHKADGYVITNFTANRCGRAINDDNTGFNRIRGVNAFNCTWWAVDIVVTAGPNQNFDLISNKSYRDIRSTGVPPRMGDCRLYMGPQYSGATAFERDGWELSDFTLNGGRARMVGYGSAVLVFPTYAASPGIEAANQLTGLPQTLTSQTGATAVTAVDVSSVVTPHFAGEIFTVPGGTLGTGGYPTLLEIVTLEMHGGETDSAGLGHAVGDILTSVDGDAITNATIRVLAVDGDGRVVGGEGVGWEYVNRGEFRALGTAFTQGATTGSGEGSYVTSVQIRKPGSGFVADELTKYAGGRPVRWTAADELADPSHVEGEGHWVILKTLTVDARGSLLTVEITDPGAFWDLPPTGEGNPGGTLNWRDTDGNGKSSAVFITGSVTRNFSLKNVVAVPKVVRVRDPGKYSVAPVGTLTPVSTNGVGALMTVTLDYGLIFDLARSNRVRVKLSGSGTIVGWGSGQGIHRECVEAGTTHTLSANARTILPNGLTSIETRPGDCWNSDSDASIPTITTISHYSPPSRLDIFPDAATTLTNGATLTPADIATGLIPVNAADNLADNYQLPTGSDLSAAFPVAVGNPVYFTLANANATAAATATLTVNTGVTSDGGSALVAASVSARIRLRRTGTNTWKFSKVSG